MYISKDADTIVRAFIGEEICFVVRVCAHDRERLERAFGESAAERPFFSIFSVFLVIITRHFTNSHANNTDRLHGTDLYHFR